MARIPETYTRFALIYGGMTRHPKTVWFQTARPVTWKQARDAIREAGYLKGYRLGGWGEGQAMISVNAEEFRGKSPSEITPLRVPNPRRRNGEKDSYYVVAWRSKMSRRRRSRARRRNTAAYASTMTRGGVRYRVVEKDVSGMRAYDVVQGNRDKGVKSISVRQPDGKWWVYVASTSNPRPQLGDEWRITSGRFRGEPGEVTSVSAHKRVGVWRMTLRLADGREVGATSDRAERYYSAKATRSNPRPRRWIQAVDREMQRHHTEGSFTRQAERAGKSVHAFATSVLAHPGRHTKRTRRRAQFALNMERIAARHARQRGRRKNHWVLPLAVGMPAGALAERQWGVASKVLGSKRRRNAYQGRSPHASATDAQIKYAESLARKAGYKYISQAFKAFYGKHKVGGWKRRHYSELIDWLKKKGR